MSTITTALEQPTGAGCIKYRWRGAFWVTAFLPSSCFRSAASPHDRNSLPDLDRVHDHGLPTILHLCGNRRPVPEQSGASIYGATAWLRIRFIGRSGLVQLLLVAGAVARLFDRRGLHPQRSGAVPLFTETSPDVVAYIAAQSEPVPPTLFAAVTAAATAIRNWTLFSHTLGPVAFVQCNLLHRRGADADHLLHPASRHPQRSVRSISAFWSCPMLIVSVVPIVTDRSTG